MPVEPKLEISQNFVAFSENTNFRIPVQLSWRKLKFIYFEKATEFFKISTLDLSYVVPVKSTVEI